MQSETPRDWGPLEGSYERALEASCEAVFPPNELGAPDWQQTDLVGRTRGYVQGLPPAQRKLLKLMFIGVELVGWLLSPGRRFSKRPLEDRTRALERWRGSGILPLRLLGDALKSSLQMIYLSHPDVVRHIGEYKVWRHPDDEFEVEVRPDCLAEMVER